jgi:hypothetical protein
MYRNHLGTNIGTAENNGEERDHSGLHFLASTPAPSQTHRPASGTVLGGIFTGQ